MSLASVTRSTPYLVARFITLILLLVIVGTEMFPEEMAKPIVMSIAFIIVALHTAPIVTDWLDKRKYL